jgi:hypothetical protein
MKSDTLHLDVSSSNILWPTFVLLLLLNGVAYGFSDQNYLGPGLPLPKWALVIINWTQTGVR